MLFNYLKIAFRSATRNRLFTLVNLVGLSIGLATTFIVMVHVQQELSYEKHIPDYKLIYRAASTEWAKVPPALAGRLKADFAEVKHITRLLVLDEQVLSHGDARAFPKYTYLADSTVNDVFHFVFERGNPATALRDPSSVVLTRSMATALFRKDEDPIGQTIKLSGFQELTVTGVIQDLPPTTHLKIDVMLPIHPWGGSYSEAKGWMALSTFIRFESLADAEKVAANMRAFEGHFRTDLTKEELDKRTDHFELHPIASIHLESHREKETEANSDMTYIYIFSAFGALILLIGSVNFINLFTAQAIKRLKEIGIRKSIGARKSQLIIQFLAEAFLMVTGSGVLAFVIMTSVLPMYNSIAPVDITNSQLLTIDNFLIIAGILLTTGLISGGYPAYVIAANHAVDIFRGARNSIVGVATVRKVLVSVQFIVSMFLLMMTAIVWSQLDYMRNANVGFTKDQVIAVKIYGSLWDAVSKQKNSTRTELLKTGLVSEMSVTNRMVGQRLGFEGLQAKGWTDDLVISTRNLLADEHYLQTMGIELLEGSNFNPDDTTTSFIINEAAAKLFRKQGIIDVVGTEVKNVAQDNQVGKIIGVIKDYNYASLHSAVEPVAISYVPTEGLLLVRLTGGNLQESVQAVESTLKRLAPEAAVVYTFLDDKLQSLYEKEYGLYYTSRVFSVLTIIIASFGLFALAANTAEARKREIGIRKVMGASIRRIVSMLCADYMRLIIVALIVTVPIAFYFGVNWLTGFSYKVAIEWWMFAIPAIVVVALALAAVIGHSLRAAMTNPADTLKHE